MAENGSYPYPTVTRGLTCDPRDGSWDCEARYGRRRFVIAFVAHGALEEPGRWHAEVHHVEDDETLGSWRAVCSGPVDGLYPNREQALFDALLYIKRWVDDEGRPLHLVSYGA